MNRFLKLLTFEINRFVKVYFGLLALTVIVQFAGVIVKSKSYLSNANTTMMGQMMTQEEYINEFGKYDFSSFMNTFWFAGPIAISAAALIFYIFLIWYREWYGKNTFVYRLLMLPISRINIYFAKALAIFLMVLGLVAVQLILLPIENELYKALVPSDFRNVMTIKEIVQSNAITMVLVPSTFIQFVLHYSMGLMALVTLFTAILFERSFRLKGIVLGLLYSAAAISLFVSPLIILGFVGLNDYLYPGEFLLIEIALGFIVILCSIWIGSKLLDKKVSV